ncbi:MAG: autotransporter domain-containing protein, partial [Desulfovibrio sp.]|nr:autotransporter domain-containing protein [Desulfovibrio sp.]
NYATLNITSLQLAALHAEDGKLNVGGSEGGFVHIDGTATVDAGKLAAAEGKGKIALFENGILSASDLVLSGKTLDIKGSVGAGSKLTLTDDLTVEQGNLFVGGGGGGAVLEGGSLTLDATSGTSALNFGKTGREGGGSINTDVTITNGSVNVQDGTWDLGNGKTIAVGANGTLKVGDTNSKATLVIASGAGLDNAGSIVQKGGGTFSVGGNLSNAATITIENGTFDLTGAETLSIDAAGKIVVDAGSGAEVAHGGVTASLEVTAAKLKDDLMVGLLEVKGADKDHRGRINVTGSLELEAGKLLETVSSAGDIGIGQYGMLHVDGLTLTPASGGINGMTGMLSVNTLNLTPQDETSDFTQNSGTVLLRGQSAVLGGTFGTDKSYVLDGSPVNLLLGGDSDDSGAINVPVTVTNGSVNVQNGAWTLNKTIDVGANGTLNVGTTKSKATLIIANNGILKSASAGDGSSAGINVFANSILEGATLTFLNKSITGETTVSDLTKAAGLSTIWLDTDANLNLNDVSGEIVTTQNMAAVKKADLITGNGLINYVGATIVVSDVDKTDDGNIKDSVASITGAILQGKTAETDAQSNGTAEVAAGGRYGADAVVVNNSQETTTSVAVTVADNLTLLGTTDGNLLTATVNKDSKSTAISNVIVADDKTLTLGNADPTVTSRDGTLNSNVVLGDNTSNSATLAVKAKTYTIGGKITTDVTDKGIVQADSGGTLIVGGDIGASGTGAVGLVSADNGSVAAAGAIYTKNITLNDGSVGTIGDITIGTEGVNSTGTSSIATEGSITSGGAITATDGNLTLFAGKAIDAASKNITATRLEAGGEIKVEALTAQDVTASKLTATGAVTLKDGTLSLGTENESKTGDLFLSGVKATVGDLEVTGEADVKNTDFSGNEVTFKGEADVENTVFTASEVTFEDDATLSGGTHATIDTLTGAADKTIAVGDSTDTVSSSLRVDTLWLKGGNLIVDPAWDATDGPNKVAVLDFGSAEIDGNVGVGQNSMLVIGTKDLGWLEKQVQAATNGVGLSDGGVEAALGLYEAQVLGTALSLVVDGDKLGSDPATYGFSANTVTFAGNSLLVVTADAADRELNADGALSAAVATAATVGEGAKLRITDAKVGKDYIVLGKNIDQGDGGTGITYTGDGSGWNGGNLSTDSRMVTLARVGDTGTFRTTLNSAANWMPKLDSELVGVVDRLWTLGDNNPNASERGVRFLTRATREEFIGADGDLAAKTIESAARMATLSGAPQMTRLINNAAGAAVTQRTSIAIPQDSLSYGIQSMAADGTVERGVNNMNKTGAALWIMPLYQSQNVNGIEAGNFDMNWNGGFGGIALGADYTFESAVRAGINFNMGGGYLNGGGDLADTTNRFNFWGIGAYLGYNVNNFGLSADVNYTHTYNEVEQDLPGGMGMSNLKSDITAHAIAVGLRGEYKFETSVMDIVPHIGVRFMNLTTDAYDVKSGGTVLQGDAIHQNIWSFPIGVAFYKTVNTGNGWFFKPSLDLSVIPAAGDIKGKSKVRFTGTDRSAELDTRIMDYVTYQGGVGLEFGTQNVSFGLNYNLQVSEHTTGHGVFGTFRYEF